MIDVKKIFQDKKVCVVVPTYNNEQTLSNVLQSILEYTDQIIVVNDGSTDNTARLIQDFSEVNVVEYSPNKGKGYALQQGFKRALELDFNYAITIDSDGQHFADDLPVFLEKLTDHPAAIIIGARNMNQASVPGRSSFGNKFSNFWFKVETGLTMNDTQSGYRLYPIKLLKEISFVTRKFEFEVEVLVRSSWSGVEITEVLVKVFYPEKEKRISHFRPFRDFTRISILNTVLVAWTFLFIKPRDFFRIVKKKGITQIISETLNQPGESDRIKAISVGFGVFMGIVPIWGLQMAIAIAVAFFFRLNKALVLIAANVSIPPMIPLILFLSHVTGMLWMGNEAKVLLFSDEITFDLVKDNFVQYVLGAITLAVISGLGSGVLTYVLLKIFKRSVTKADELPIDKAVD